MGKTTLVGLDVQLGERVLSTLDDAGFPVTVAVWALNERLGGWQLVLGTPLYDKVGPREAIFAMIKALTSAEEPIQSHEVPIRLEGLKYPLIRNLRRRFKKTDAVHGMRLGGPIGDVWVDDGYVYRIR